MLRRLRWHRHQSGGLHHKSSNTMTSDLCSFIRGDKPDNNTSKGHPVKEHSFETMATAMKEQQSRATVGLTLFILMDYPIHIDTISRDLFILYFKGLSVINYISVSEVFFINANSADPDEILPSAAFHLDLHVCQRT